MSLDLGTDWKSVDKVLARKNVVFSSPNRKPRFHVEGGRKCASMLAFMAIGHHNPTRKL